MRRRSSRIGSASGFRSRVSAGSRRSAYASARMRRSAIVAVIASADRRLFQKVERELLAVALRTRSGCQAMAGDEREHGLHALGHAVRAPGEERMRARRREQREARAWREADADFRMLAARREQHLHILD